MGIQLVSQPEAGKKIPLTSSPLISPAHAPRCAGQKMWSKPPPHLPNQSCADASQTTCSTGLKSPVCSISLMTSGLASCLAGLSRSAPEQFSQADLSKHPHAPHVPKALTTNNSLAPSHGLEPPAMASSPCRIRTTLCPLIQSLSILLFSFSTSSTPNHSFLVSKDAPVVPHLWVSVHVGEMFCS